MKISTQLNCIGSNLEQIARFIYYAKQTLPKNHSAHANLDLALEMLGIHHPREVGLSERVLRNDD